MIKEKLDKFYVKDKAYGINNFINKVKHILTEKIKTYIAYWGLVKIYIQLHEQITQLKNGKDNWQFME